VDLSQRPFTVNCRRRSTRCRALIIATGASARLLGLPSERTLMGHGVSTCATCDGYFFRGKPIAVVGGGDTAMEEAIFLTRFASHVTVVHRRDALRASKIMQDKAFANPKISFEWNTEVEDIKDAGRGEVTAATLRNTRTGRAEGAARGGRVHRDRPHAEHRRSSPGSSTWTPNGYIITHDGTRTSVPGVFACGDVQDHVYRQAITAAGSGCMAAIDAEKYLEGVPQHLGEAALCPGFAICHLALTRRRQSIHPPPSTSSPS
jgi:thioredoxin reductase (NADPH)